MNNIVMTKIIRLILHLFYLFPIKKNRIVFNSHTWKQYSCNPRYISEYLQEEYGDQFEIIWVFKDVSKFEYLNDKGIKLVRLRTVLFYYYALTAKIMICNVSNGAEIPKRKEQIWINTWHGGGGGYKKDSYDGTLAYRPRLEFKQTDYFCASSETSLENSVRRSFNHQGGFFPGTPRNDMLVNNDRTDIKENVYDYFKIDYGVRTLLYAPTYREGADRRTTSDQINYGLDYAELHKCLTEVFGGDWRILIRFHPKIHDYSMPNYSYCIDATKYPDMQELLVAVDSMITDYSSSIWDFSFTNKPCFLFCEDLEEYIEKRGFNKPIFEWGFSVSKSNEELENAIRTWNAKNYVESMNFHHTSNGSFEDGKATKRVCDFVYQRCIGGE